MSEKTMTYRTVIGDDGTIHEGNEMVTGVDEAATELLLETTGYHTVTRAYWDRAARDEIAAKGYEPVLDPCDPDHG